jgi:hypothetical protein
MPGVAEEGLGFLDCEERATGVQSRINNPDCTTDRNSCQMKYLWHFVVPRYSRISADLNLNETLFNDLERKTATETRPHLSNIMKLKQSASFRGIALELLHSDRTDKNVCPTYAGSVASIRA